jgi:hypothetical protein
MMRQDLAQVAPMELGLIDPVSQLGEVGVGGNGDLEPVAGFLECLLGFIYSLLLWQIGQLLLVVLNKRLDLSVSLTDFALKVMDALKLLHIHTQSDLTFPIRWSVNLQ